VKYASLKVLVLVLATGSLIAACASGNDTTDFGAGGASGTTTSSSPPDTGTTSVGTGGGGGATGSGTSTSGSGGTCIPKCFADYDCQNSCPAAQTGINCCDTATGLCYVASTSICPMPQTDGGTMMPPY
jgi:hypothetical protein